MRQIKEEIKRMLDKKEIIKALIVPLIMAIIFSYIFGNNQILEAKVFVADLDNSSYSRQLIDKLDASSYIQVAKVINTPVEPDLILSNDKYQAVLSLPRGLEQNVYRNVQTNIGVIVDNTVMSSTSYLRQAVNEIVATENITLGVSKLKVLGISGTQASALMSNFTVQQRLLFNPTGDFVNTNVFCFFNLFMLFLLLSSTAKIIPTLRQENVFHENIKDPLGLISRVLPYSIIYLVSSVLSLGILKQFMGLRFAGSFGEFLVPLFLYTFTTGMLGMLVSWTAKDTEHVTGRMISIVFPSLILSNILLPIIYMPNLIQLLSYCLPLNWYARFFRAIGLRGASISYLNDYVGGFLILTSVILCLLVIVMIRSGKKTLNSEQ